MFEQVLRAMYFIFEIAIVTKTNVDRLRGFLFSQQRMIISGYLDQAL
jgi:hypothetical protein